MDFGVIIAHIVFFSATGLLFYVLAPGREKFRELFNIKAANTETDVPSKYFRMFDAILRSRNTYYQKLSFQGKKKFIYRISRFNKDKKFVGRQGLEVTFEMQVMIGGAAVQLTYGMENYQMNHIREIRVYPQSFYVPKHRVTGELPPRTKEEMEFVRLRGKTSAGGMIGLSWKDFTEGYDVPDDNYNLGLHEMAHALKLSLNEGSDFDNKFSFYLDDWMEIGSEVFRKMGESSRSFLRAYGGTNMHEFFAVCIEHFFESPAQFKSKLPDLYNHLCFLLNQNPMNKENDYELTEDYIESVNLNPSRIPFPEEVKRHYKYHNWHWTLTFVMLGIFPGFITIMLIGTNTELNFLRFAGISGGVVLLASGIQYPYLFKNGVLGWRGFSAYCGLGLVPAFFGLYLLLNFLFTVKAYEESYAIKELHFTDYEIIVDLKSGAYHNQISYRTLSVQFGKNMLVARPQNLSIFFTEGIFGMRVHKETQFSGFLHPEAIRE